MTASAGTLEVEVAKLIAGILQAEMELDEAHCLLGDQKWNIPADEKLFVVVFDQTAPPIGAANYLETDEASENFGKEIQQSLVLHDVRIEIMSFDNEARVRKEEPGLALASFYAQQVAGRYLLQIGRAQPAVNASETEEVGRLQKFVMHANVSVLHQKVKALPTADYYDKFNVRPGFADAVNPPSTNAQE